MTQKDLIVRLQPQRFGDRRSMPSLTLLPGLLEPGVIVLDGILSMDQIELLDI